MVIMTPLQDDVIGKKSEGISPLIPSSSTPGDDEKVQEKDSLVDLLRSRLRCDDLVVNQNPGDMLPADVLEDILMRLPFSARCRLRFVCRKWKDDLLSLPYRNLTMSPCMIWSRLGIGNPRFFCPADEQWFGVPSTAFMIPLLSDLHPSSGKSWKMMDPNWWLDRERDTPILTQTVQESVFTVPSNVNESSESKRELSWELVDVDAGLLCYRRNVAGSFWLCVSNPLTCHFRIIPPSYYHERFKSNPYMLKLLVDRKAKSFKVFVVLNTVLDLWTAIYDSTTSSWVLCFDHPNNHYYEIGRILEYPDYKFPGIHKTDHEMFVWKKVVYLYNTARVDYFGNPVMSFSLKFGRWMQASFQFPFGRWMQASFQHSFQSPTNMKCFILSDMDRMFLVQFCPGRNSQIFIWRLLDDGLSPLESDDGCYDPDPHDWSTHADFAEWEEVFAGSSKTMARNEGIILPGELGHVCHGAGYIYFTFRGKENKANGFRIHICLRFSLADESWEVVPCPTDWKDPFKVYHWEPSLDADPILLCDKVTSVSENVPS